MGAGGPGRGGKQMKKCGCGKTFYISAGEGIQDGIFRWYVSYHCINCGRNIEMDGTGIESIPKEVQSWIIEKEGLWELKSTKNEIKFQFLLRKLLGKGGTFRGTQNQVKWIKSKLMEKGVMEDELEMEKVD